MNGDGAIDDEDIEKSNHTHGMFKHIRLVFRRRGRVLLDINETDRIEWVFE